MLVLLGAAVAITAVPSALICIRHHASCAFATAHGEQPGAKFKSVRNMREGQGSRFTIGKSIWQVHAFDAHSASASWGSLLCECMSA